MPINTVMPLVLKPFYNKELADANTELQLKNWTKSWRHLERAHIIGQAYPFAHTYSHWKMLLFALKLKQTKEIIGQLPRLFVGGVKSFVGHIPVGNTGGANVPPLMPMEIPEDLQLILEKVKK